MRQIANTYYNRLQGQIRPARVLAFCSPYAVLSDVTATLANTGGESQMAFLKMARQYEDGYFSEQYRKGLRISRYAHVDDPPLFRIGVSNLRERIKQSLPGIGLLVVFGIFFFMAGYLLFLRHPLERV